MPSPKKIFFHGGVHFITTTVEEGLMFPPNPLINELLKKSLARAQELHPIDISALLCNTTHVHLIARVIDPQDAADFMERFKTESAHAINRLLGRTKRTIWCEGYDSPLIEDPETVKDKIAYIYENVSKDYLEDSIEKYPGLSTWAQIKKCCDKGSSQVLYETRYIARKDFQALPKDKQLSESDYRTYRRKLIYRKAKNHLKIDVNAWMERFGIVDRSEQRKTNQAIVKDVLQREEDHRAKRRAAKKTVIGRRRLIERPVGAPHSPERDGKRMYTHSNDPKIRVATIKWIQKLVTDGKEVLELWRQGDLSVPYPLGLFPPHGIRRAEPIGW